MMARRLAGVVVAMAGALGIAALSHVPWTEHPANDAQLRLAWRFRSERAQVCRRLSAEELARLPVHMRQPEVCEGGLRPYRLQVEVDGGSLADDTVRGRGASADRPLFVFREFALAAGTHQVRVTFSPLGEGADTTRVTPPLRFDAAVELRPRRVGMVTLDPERGVLVLRQGMAVAREVGPPANPSSYSSASRFSVPE